MGIVNENVSQTFTATAGQTIFPFSLNFFATSDLVIKKNGVALTAPEYSIGSLVGSVPYTGATMTLTTGATLNDSIEVIRIAAFTMQQFLALNDSFAAKAPAIQEALDKVTLMAQEAKKYGVDAQAIISQMPVFSLPTPSSLQGLRWNLAANALENADFALNSRVADVEVDVTALQGSLSTQIGRIDAEESKSISFQSSINTLANITGQLISSVSVLEAWKPLVDNYIQDLRTRMQALEKFFGLEGTISILNNQLAPVEVPEFELDGNVTTSVRLDFEIRRQTGTEYRLSTGTLHLGFKSNGVWETDRNVTSFDVDGVSFTIVTGPNDIGKVYYTTDEVLGAGYTGAMKFRRYSFGV